MTMDIKWFEKSGNEGDIVISSRIRLARNLQSMPFPIRMNEQQKQEVRNKIVQMTKQSLNEALKGLTYIDMEQVDKIEAVSMVENHLVSPDFISHTKGKGLLVSKDNCIAVMINEEDHLRIQVMKEGMDLEAIYLLADQLDTAFNEMLQFAFDSELGYLTQCPTNLGTGMRASLMLHLPALQKNGIIKRLANNLSKLGLTLRGTYGEGTEPIGALYQLSNQVTLGLSEREAIENLERIVMQLVEEERHTRKSLMAHIQEQDLVARSLGVLKSAKVLSSEEFIQFISNVRFGIAAGLIQGISYDTVNRLMISTQPATMMTLQGKRLTQQERDTIRANMVTEAFQQAEI